MKKDIPVILIKNLVLFPFQELRLDINNINTKNNIKLACKNYDSKIIISSPLDLLEECPDLQDLPAVCCIAKIKNKIELPNGDLRVVVAGVERCLVERYYFTDEEVLVALTKSISSENNYDPVKYPAYIQKLNESLKIYISSSPYVSNSIINTIDGISDLSKYTDIISAFISFPFEKKYSLLIETNPINRAEKLLNLLAIEIEINSLDEQLEDDIKDNLEQNQKEFLIKEKIKQLQKELGESSSKEIEVALYYQKLDDLNVNPKTYVKIKDEIKKYEIASELSPDATVIRNYLEWVLNLPWNKSAKEEQNPTKILKALDKSHYGLKSIKDRIIEYMMIKNRNKNFKSPIICLVGPPGVGKTTLSSCIAQSLNREFYKINVGGLNDSAELIGHRRTYLGASPGRIIQALKKCETNNPVILIDEIDKMVKDFKGDPASTLLEILDSSQNNQFVDNYIEEPFDLSNVLFIMTANSVDEIAAPLLDRLEIIELNSYTEYEKIDIATKYLLPIIFDNHLVKKDQIKLSKEIVAQIINKYTKEAGVRGLERTLNTIVRKVVTDAIKNNQDVKITIDNELLTKYLGPAKYDSTKNILYSIGTANALAYTPFGGDLLPIQVCLYSGKEEYIMTGSIGKVMEESLRVALSYIKQNLELLSLDKYLFNDQTIHLHALETAVNKEGPSAGIAVVTAILSYITKKTVNKDTAFTGEITLNGDIIKIGGLKEKIIGGFNAGIHKFYVPTSNKNDIKEIPEDILKKAQINFVDNYQTIIEDIFK